MTYESEILDPKCNAERKCWEHWQPDDRVMEKDIDDAEIAALTLATMLPHRPTVSQIEAVVEAYRLVGELISSQWRQMVRQPFQLDPPRKKVSTPRPAATRKPATTSDLESLL